jgi:hypothetical protein
MGSEFTRDTDNPNRITLKPLLLNGHEWIDIQFVSDGDPRIPDVESRVAGETRSMVGMMYRAEKIRRQQTLAAILVVTSVLILTGISLFTTNQFEDQEMLPLVAFAAGYLLGSIPLLNQVQTRKHRSWARKQT